jgi:hypothetical protein
MTEAKYKMMHLGERGCGMIAFYLRRKLVAENPITDKDVIWLNGEDAKVDELIKCGNCDKGYPPGMNWLEDWIREVE